MIRFHLLGNWVDSIDPELHALKGFTALLLAASSSTRYEMESVDLNYIAVLHGQIVDNLEKRLKELDQEVRKLQTKEVAA